MNPPQPAGELRILIGGFLEECIGQLIAEIIKKYLGYTHVSVQIIESLPAFLKAAAQSPPDLFMVYLYFSDPTAETVADPATCRAEIHTLLADATPNQPPSVTGFCGLRLVTHLRAEFGKPVMVLTGCGHEPGRPTRVEQAGASAFLTLPFAIPDCVAAIGSCVEKQLKAS